MKKFRVQGYSEEEARAEALAVVEGVKEMVRRFMTLTEFGGNPTPANWMLRLRTYGMTIRYNTAEDGKIRWNGNGNGNGSGNEISFGRISFTMAMLRSMVHGLTATAREEMQEKLLLVSSSQNSSQISSRTSSQFSSQIRGRRWSQKLPRLEIGLLRDNPAEMTGGWNFLKDERNEFQVDGRRWLHSRILREPRLQRQFIQRSKAPSKRMGAKWFGERQQSKST